MTSHQQRTKDLVNKLADVGREAVEVTGALVRHLLDGGRSDVGDSNRMFTITVRDPGGRHLLRVRTYEATMIEQLREQFPNDTVTVE